jgi:FkbM family methyltransferase
MSSVDYGKDGYCRPASDALLREVEWMVVDTDKAIARCPQRRVAVQAGGAYGLWPLHLAKSFAHVYTLEPDALNFRCLVENIGSSSNITPIRAALGAEAASAALKRAKPENAGSGYVIPGDDFAVVPLDQLALKECDFLCLDVEGYELAALQGATQTIERCRPVVMIEIKQLPQMMEYGVTRQSAVDWLVEHGYREVERIHRDSIFVGTT